MSSLTGFRIAASALVGLIGVAMLAGGAQLHRGGAAAWPDLVADAEIVRRAAVVLLIFGVALIASAVMTALDAPGGRLAAAIATSAFVLIAFWGNKLLFGDWRPLHTGTNVVVLAIVLWLLRMSSARGI
jgi:hypothetical protein